MHEDRESFVVRIGEASRHSLVIQQGEDIRSNEADGSLAAFFKTRGLRPLELPRVARRTVRLGGAPPPRAPPGCSTHLAATRAPSPEVTVTSGPTSA
jgi:hypothetical protein